MRAHTVILRGLIALTFGTVVRGVGAEERRESRGECAAALERSDSLRDHGKYLGARAALGACSRQACSRGVTRLCGERLRDLDALTPTVVPRATDEKGRDLPSAHVTLDGAVLALRLDGSPIATDPGEHVFRFDVAGAPAVEKVVVIRSGEKGRLVAVVMHAASPAAAVGSVRLDSASLTTPAREATPARDNGPRGITSLSIVTLALATGAIGEYFILHSTQLATTAGTLRAPLAPDACVGSASATCLTLGDTVDAEHRDLSLGRALLGAGVGLALVAAATWFFWPARRPDPTRTMGLSPSLARGGGGLSVVGAF